MKYLQRIWTRHVYESPRLTSLSWEYALFILITEQRKMPCQIACKLMRLRVWRHIVLPFGQKVYTLTTGAYLSNFEKNCNDIITIRLLRQNPAVDFHWKCEFDRCCQINLDYVWYFKYMHLLSRKKIQNQTEQIVPFSNYKMSKICYDAGDLKMSWRLNLCNKLKAVLLCILDLNI